MAKKKVLLLTDIIAPYRISVLNLLAENQNFDFTVLSLTKNMLGREWRFSQNSIKFNYRILNNIQFPLPLPNRLPVVIERGLYAALEDIRPDLVIITGYYHFAFLRTLLYCKKKNIKVICGVESHLQSIRLRDTFSYYYRYWFLNKCDAFIVPGRRSREYLLSLKIDENMIFTAPNAVDNDFYYVDIKNKYSDNDKQALFQRYPRKNFLYVGRLIRDKGIEMLLRAYNDLNFGNDIGLILVGDGKDGGYFKRLSARLKLRNIFFEGFKQKDELKDYYKLADIFVFPSLRDEWGMVLNEAAIAGLPIITSEEVGASEALVSNKNGWIFKKGDINILRNYLRGILLPEGELIKKGIESQRLAALHSPQRCARSIIDGVNKILEEKRIIASCPGISYGYRTTEVFYNLKLLATAFISDIQRGKSDIPRNFAKSMFYPYIFFKPIIKSVRKYRNISNIFVNKANMLFDKRVSNQLRRIRYDIFYGFSGSSFYSMVEAKQHGRICILDQHDIYYKATAKVFDEEIRKDPDALSSISYWPPHKGYLERVDEELKIADYIFVPSTFSLRTHVDSGIPREKLVLMPFGVPSDSIKRKATFDKKNDFRVGFIGTIGLRKGIKYLLEAVKEIANPDIKVYIAGSFSANSNILDRYKGYYKSRGYVKSSKMDEFISSLDVLVLPSLIDSFGLVILEAMAQGVPVIASENTAGPDIITDYKDGFIVPIRNVAAIKEKILFLYNDREKKIEMGQKSIDRVKDFTWDKYAERFQNFVKTINF